MTVDGFQATREYQRPLPGLEPGMKVLDVGPGTIPLPEATRCLDRYDIFHGVDYSSHRLAPRDVGDVTALPYASGAFDYVYCSHCLEHSESPARGLAELVRVGRRGYAEVPTAMLDWFMQHGEVHSRWLFLQLPNGLVAVERSPEATEKFSREGHRNLIHRVTQGDARRLSKGERILRESFWSAQLVLNASVSWDEARRPECWEFRLEGKEKIWSREC